MASGKRFWKLFIINTLDSIQKIDSVVEGLVVGILGILLGVAGFYSFRHIGLELSAEISLLSVFAYAAVCIYHIYGYEKEVKRLEGPVGKVIERAAELILLLIAVMIFYILIFDQILIIRIVAESVRSSQGILKTLVRSIPGLVILSAPLFGWEKFAELTPTDDILKKVFRK